jgi:uncharacterized repeat protein (TIGR03806 family)
MPRIPARAGGLSLLACAGTLLAAPGLDGPESMGPYFNGVFPDTPPEVGAGNITTELAFPNLVFQRPIFLAPVPGGTRLAVVEKAGRIWTFENTPAASSRDIMLNLVNDTPSGGGEVFKTGDSGMTGIAFHPEFATNPSKRFIYVSYKWRPGGSANSQYAFWRLSRFQVPSGTLEADFASELVMVQQFDRQMWHDAGSLLFGDDGFLYFSIGDEGGKEDEFNSAQKLDDRFFAGLFRIDVDSNAATSHAIRRQPATHPDNPWAPTHVSLTQGYMIPDDNPFLDPGGGLLEEYYCLGLRNTFKFYKHPETGLLFGGDVGQVTREEFNLLVRGGNYGWPFREGFIAGPKPAPDPIPGTLVDPIWDYPRSSGQCVIGGAVYRGSEIPELFDKHLLVDNVSMRIWALTVTGSTVTEVEELAPLPGQSGTVGPTHIAADHDGELYILKIEGGRIYKFTTSTATPVEPPATLSATGLFSDLQTLTPAPGLFPYTPNCPLWSDNTSKQRWVGIPNNGTHDTPGEKIRFSANGNWQWPEGTVFIKHFELPTDQNNPAVTTRVETRVMAVLADGSAYGVTYKWRDSQLDADLLTAGGTKDYPIVLAGGGSATQTWDFPSRPQCMQCHTAGAGYVLGLRTHQLNGDQHYPRTSRTANQLETFSSLGWFDDAYAPDLLPYYLKSHPIDDPAVPLETRARSYLDSNCSHCHRPGGVRAFFDARFTTPLRDQNLLHGSLFGSFIGPGEAVVVPGDPALSVAPHRMDLVGSLKMPPLAKRMVDAAGVQVVEDWISSLEARPGVTLGAASAISGPFEVAVEFSSPVSGLDPDDFQLSNAIATALAPGADASLYTLSVTPAGPGNMMIHLPADRALDASGAGNYPSNLLVVGSVDADLATWLAFEDGSGITATDASGNGNAGTLLNMTSASWTEGHCGDGLSFDGVDDNLNLNNIATGDFTVALWIHTSEDFAAGSDALAATRILDAELAGTANDWLLAGGNDGGVNRALFFTGNPDTTIAATSEISTGQWVHLAATREAASGTMRLYIDGTEEASTTGANTVNLDASSVLQVGGTGTDRFTGSIDELRLYNRVLTPGEITALQICTDPDSPYVQWAKVNLPGLTHLQGPLQDPEGDGLANLLDWGFGFSPLAFDASPVRAGVGAGGRLTIRFPRLDTAPQPDYTILVSENMLSWAPGDPHLTEIAVEDLPGPTELVTYEYSGPLGADGVLFGRVKVQE